MHQSFLGYRDYRWLKLAVLLTVLVSLVYLFHSSNEPPNGGTWLGYTLGTVGALLIVWLAWLGIRKRSYSSSLGTVQGWLSAHVWLGLALFVVGTLHTGFQLGLNVHTLAYALMCLVIASGILGVFLYWNAPHSLSAAKRGRTIATLHQAMLKLDEQAGRLAASSDAETAAAVADAVARTALPTRWLDQLRQRDHSKIALPGHSATELEGNPRHETLIAWVTEQAAISSGKQLEVMRELLKVLASRRDITTDLLKALQLQAQLSGWLLVHIPATVALLVALAIHIFSVFIYW